MSRWTHPVCDHCWEYLNPETPSPWAGQGEKEECCYCGRITRSGIYVRENPDALWTHKHGRSHNDDDG